MSSLKLLLLEWRHGQLSTECEVNTALRVAPSVKWTWDKCISAAGRLQTNQRPPATGYRETLMIPDYQITNLVMANLLIPFGWYRITLTT